MKFMSVLCLVVGWLSLLLLLLLVQLRMLSTFSLCPIHFGNWIFHLVLFVIHLCVLLLAVGVAAAALCVHNSKIYAVVFLNFSSTLANESKTTQNTKITLNFVNVHHTYAFDSIWLDLMRKSITFTNLTSLSNRKKYCVIMLNFWQIFKFRHFATFFFGKIWAGAIIS